MKGIFLMLVVQIASWVARLAGAVALLMGLFFWGVELGWLNAPLVFDPAYINVHMTFGVLVTLALLVLSVALVLTSGGRVLGTIGVVYALIVPIYGELQLNLYVSGAPWLVPAIHLLIGLGAIGLAQNIGGRYQRLKSAAGKITAPEGAGVSR
jgi:hypothetical protein